MLLSRLRWSRPQTNGARLVNAKSQALNNTMAGNKEELKEEPVNDTQGDVEAEVLVETMADTAVEVKAKALIQMPPDKDGRRYN